MKNSQNKKVLQTCLFVLLAIVVLGIGYAFISEINLIVNSNATVSVNQNNFIVHFIEAKNITGTTGVGGTSVIESDDTKASFNVTGLSKVGDYAEAKYVVKNDSNGIGAEITLDVTNSNSEYFKVTETIDYNKLQAGDTTFATVKVEMIKTPIDSDVSTGVTATVKASPIDNSSATGGESVIVGPIPDPVSFSTDSWATIKKAVQDNNTSLYNVGDTKTITINNVDYTIRVANKSTYDWCNDEAYSQSACGFVVEFADIIAKMKMNNGTKNTNAGGYPETLVADYLNNTFYGDFPQDLRSSILPTRLISGHGYAEARNYTSTDYVYLLSVTEVLGSSMYDAASGTTHILDYYLTNSTKKQYNGTDESWWLRSAYSEDKVSFSDVGPYGYWGNATSLNFEGVSPAFRIG